MILSDNPEYSVVWHLSRPMKIGLTEFCCIEIKTMKIVMSCFHKTCMYTVSISHQERQYLDNNHTYISPTHFVQTHLIIIKEFIQLQRNYSRFHKKIFIVMQKYCKLAQISIQ